MTGWDEVECDGWNADSDLSGIGLNDDEPVPGAVLVIGTAQLISKIG